MSYFIEAIGDVNPVLLAFTLAVVAAACWERWEEWLQEKREKDQESSRKE